MRNRKAMKQQAQKKLMLATTQPGIRVRKSHHEGSDAIAGKYARGSGNLQNVRKAVGL